MPTHPNHVTNQPTKQPLPFIQGALAGSCDGHSVPAMIYSGAADGSVGAWSADGRCRQLLPCHRGAVTLLAAAPTRSSSPSCQPAACQSRAELQSVMCGPAGELLVTAGGEGSAALWDLSRHRVFNSSPLLERDEATSLARVVAWDAARGVLLRGDERGVVRAWAPGLSTAI